MKVINLYRFYKSGLLICLLMIVFLGCTDIYDTHKEYTVPTKFAQKIRRVTSYPGRNRVKFNLLFPSTSRVDRGVVTIGDKVTSFSVPQSTDSLKIPLIIDKLTEGTHKAEIYTYFQDTLKSIKTDVFFEVYGKSFQSLLTSRVPEFEMYDIGIGRINWMAPAPTEIFSLLTYSSLSGESLTDTIKTDSTTQLINNIDISKGVTVTSAFLPVPSCIDTFYATSTITDIAAPCLASIWSGSLTGIDSVFQQHPANCSGAVVEGNCKRIDITFDFGGSATHRVVMKLQLGDLDFSTMTGPVTLTENAVTASERYTFVAGNAGIYDLNDSKLKLTGGLLGHSQVTEYKIIFTK